MDQIELRDFDRRIWAEELEAFVPGQVFDAHVHLWSEAARGDLSGPPTGLRRQVDFERLRRWSRRIFPGRRLAFLALGTPLPGMDVAYTMRVARAAFGKRRKTLRNTLTGGALGLTRDQALEALETANIEPGRRPQTLDWREFAALANAIGAITTRDKQNG